MGNLPRAPLSYGALSIHRFHQVAFLCWSSGLETHTRAVVAALLRHWDEAIPRNYPRMYSVYIRLLSCAPQRPTNGGTHLLRRVTCRINCQKWTQCHGSPGLAQVDTPASASSHQHEAPRLTIAHRPVP